MSWASSNSAPDTTGPGGVGGGSGGPSRREGRVSRSSAASSTSQSTGPLSSLNFSQRASTAPRIESRRTPHGSDCRDSWDAARSSAAPVVVPFSHAAGSPSSPISAGSNFRGGGRRAAPGPNAPAGTGSFHRE